MKSLSKDIHNKGVRWFSCPIEWFFGLKEKKHRLVHGKGGGKHKLMSTAPQTEVYPEDHL